MGTSMPVPRGIARLAAILTFVTALFVPLVAPAADAGASKTLGELYTVALLMDGAVLDLNMLLGEDQGPAYKARLNATIENLESAQKTSSASLGTAGINAKTAADIENNVVAFIRLLRQNRDTTLKSGSPEGAVVDEMMQRRKDARKALDPVYADLEKKAGLSGSPLSEARDLALLLQQMAALYVESASAAGGVSQRTHDESDATIDSLARSFSTRLATLGTRAKGEESTKLMHGIESKWRFIEKSMINYHEKTVPFLVDRYTQAIVTDLVKLAEALEHGN